MPFQPSVFSVRQICVTIWPTCATGVPRAMQARHGERVQQGQKVQHVKHVKHVKQSVLPRMLGENEAKR